MSKTLIKLACPECGSEEFIMGPVGGAAQRVSCAKCNYWMNVSPLPNGTWWVLEEGKGQPRMPKSLTDPNIKLGQPGKEK